MLIQDVGWDNAGLRVEWVLLVPLMMNLVGRVQTTPDDSWADARDHDCRVCRAGPANRANVICRRPRIQAGSPPVRIVSSARPLRHASWTRAGCLGQRSVRRLRLRCHRRWGWLWPAFCQLKQSSKQQLLLLHLVRCMQLALCCHTLLLKLLLRHNNFTV